MEKKQLDIPILVKILNISLTEFDVLKEIPNQLTDIFDKNNVQFEFNAQTKVSIPDQKIEITLNVNFFLDKEKKNKIGYINSFGEFEVSNISDILKNFEGKIPIPILANLLGILVSSTRGFLILKSEKTIMQSIFMPVVNPHTFFQNSSKPTETKK